MERFLWLFLLIALLGLLGFWFLPKEQEENPRDIFVPQPAPAQTETPIENTAVSLPYAPESWDLVAEKLICYDGPYIEDGTNAPVSDVAGLILHNAGDRGISFAVLAVEQGSKTTYFTVTWLPPGERVLVLAMQQAVYDPEPVTDCRVLGIRWDDFASAQVEVSASPEGGLYVTNLTVKRQEQICLRFKQYTEEYGMFFGGITQCITIPVLMPGENRPIYPEEFDPEHSRLVAKVK